MRPLPPRPPGRNAPAVPVVTLQPFHLALLVGQVVGDERQSDPEGPGRPQLVYFWPDRYYVVLLPGPAGRDLDLRKRHLLLRVRASSGQLIHASIAKNGRQTHDGTIRRHARPCSFYDAKAGSTPSTSIVTTLGFSHPNKRASAPADGPSSGSFRRIRVSSTASDIDTSLGTSYEDQGTIVSRMFP